MGAAGTELARMLRAEADRSKMAVDLCLIVEADEQATACVRAAAVTLARWLTTPIEQTNAARKAEIDRNNGRGINT